MLVALTQIAGLPSRLVFALPEKLGDLVAQYGYDWLVGKWAATADNGQQEEAVTMVLGVIRGDPNNPYYRWIALGE